MTRIIIHAGFHKTGTTSLQSFMSENEALLGAHVRFYRKRLFRRTAQATVRMATHPRNPWYPLRFAAGFLRFLMTIRAGDPRPIVISWEGFCGTIPGNMGVPDYRHAPRIARLVLRLLRLRFGRGADIAFLYTTREAESWRQSAHAHLVKYLPFTQTLEEYRRATAGAPDFDAVVARIAAAIAPVPVLTAALEDTAADPAGPASALLDLLAIPAELRARLAPVAPVNRSVPPEQTEAFRALNLKTPPGAELRRTKMTQAEKML